MKLLGMVNAVPDLRGPSKGSTAALISSWRCFGEQHARSAIGVGSLPFGIRVEIEAIFEVD